MIDDLLRLIVDCVTDRTDLYQLELANRLLNQFVNDRLTKLSLLIHYQSIHRSLFSSKSESIDESNQNWLTPWIFITDLGIDVRISMISAEKTIYLFIKSKIQSEPKSSRVINLKFDFVYYHFLHRASQFRWNPSRRVGYFEIGFNIHPHTIGKNNQKWFMLVLDFSSIGDPQLRTVSMENESFRSINFPQHETALYSFYDMLPTEHPMLINNRDHLIKCTSKEKHPKIIQFDSNGKFMSQTKIKEFDRFCTFAGSFGINDRYLLFLKITNGGNILITVGIFDTYDLSTARCFINTKTRHPTDYNFYTKTFQWCQKNRTLVVCVFHQDHHFSFIDGSLKHLSTSSSTRDKQIVHYIYDPHFDTNIQFC